MEWVSVKERNPFTKERLSFVCANGEIFSNEIWFDREKMQWMEDGFNGYYGVCHRQVTHFMPMPELPKDV